MIATTGKGGNTRCHYIGVKFLDHLEHAIVVNWINRRVADIADTAKIEGIDVTDMVNASNKARHVTNFPRAVPCTRPVRYSAIPGDAG